MDICSISRKIASFGKPSPSVPNSAVRSLPEKAQVSCVISRRHANYAVKHGIVAAKIELFNPERVKLIEQPVIRQTFEVEKISEEGVLRDNTLCDSDDLLIQGFRFVNSIKHIHKQAVLLISSLAHVCCCFDHGVQNS